MLQVGRMMMNIRGLALEDPDSTHAKISTLKFAHALHVEDQIPSGVLGKGQDDSI